ncbi:hypothetical protein JW851_03750 [Candidatus Woesearchaeota archaeon]|nr:hypothetical protein [Candidatus Woesearchaeota archaeon]
MATTIQVSKDLLEQLRNRKMYDSESYEGVIRDLLEDTMELSEETKKELEKSRKEIKAGKFKTLSEVKKELQV